MPHGIFLTTSTPQTIKLGILEEEFEGSRCIYLPYWEGRVLVDTGIAMQAKRNVVYHGPWKSGLIRVSGLIKKYQDVKKMEVSVFGRGEAINHQPTNVL
jgi:hypothetical protein